MPKMPARPHASQPPPRPVGFLPVEAAGIEPVSQGLQPSVGGGGVKTLTWYW